MNWLPSLLGYKSAATTVIPTPLSLEQWDEVYVVDGYSLPLIVIGKTVVTVTWFKGEQTQNVVSPDQIPTLSEDDPDHYEQIGHSVTILKKIASQRQLQTSVKIDKMDDCIQVSLVPK